MSRDEKVREALELLDDDVKGSHLVSPRLGGAIACLRAALAEPTESTHAPLTGGAREKVREALNGVDKVRIQQLGLPASNRKALDAAALALREALDAEPDGEVMWFWVDREGLSRRSLSKPTPDMVLPKAGCRLVRVFPEPEPERHRADGDVMWMIPVHGDHDAFLCAHKPSRGDAKRVRVLPEPEQEATP